MVEILIESATILTMDAKRRVIEDGAVAIDGSRIIEVGTTEELRKKYTAEKVIDGKNKLVMPGLVDAHFHLHHTLCRGIPGLTLDKIFSMLYGCLDRDSYYISSLLSCVEMVKTGTTCFVDCGTIPGGEEVAVEAVKKVGIRAVLGRTTWDIYEEPAFSTMPERGAMFSRETTDEALRRGEKFIQQFHKKDDRIQAWLNLNQVPNCSEEVCRGAKELADKYQVGLLTHAGNRTGARSELQAERTIKLFGMTDIEYLDSVGVVGSNLLATHMGWISGKELMIVKERNASVVHTGVSSRSPYSLIPEMIDMGINVALGCDTSNHSLDMVRQMFQAATVWEELRLAREVGLIYKVMPPERVVEMATLNGAKALLWGKDIGSLEAGKKADIVIFDLKRPEWTPIHKYNVIRNLVYSATGDSVNTVIIDGRIIMENREVKTVDEAEIIERAQKEVEKFLNKADWLHQK